MQPHQRLCCVYTENVEYLQNWDIGASNCGAAPPLELSFCTWVGGTGLCDWPVARYMACTHRIRSCSSSLAKITVSPSFTALKNVRPPSRPGPRAQTIHTAVVNHALKYTAKINHHHYLYALIQVSSNWAWIFNSKQGFSFSFFMGGAQHCHMEVAFQIVVFVCKGLPAVTKMCYLAGGQCSPQCNHQAGEAPQAQPSSLCSCTWQTCTGSPAPITRGSSWSLVKHNFTVTAIHLIVYLVIYIYKLFIKVWVKLHQ